MIDVVQAFWKPVNWTSFDVVRKMRNVTRVKKVGHAGTLDPFAEGVLVLCFGRATKQVSQIMAWEKEYVATLKLGETTDTLDPTGKVTGKGAIPSVTVEQIRAVLQSFVGAIMQVPPMYSALKVGGKRLYELARSGKTIERSPRPVEIYRIELMDWQAPDEMTIRVVCGKGTYIRSLAADVAVKLGTVGYLTRLVRTRVGEYDHDAAIPMDEAEHWTPIAA